MDMLGTSLRMALSGPRHYAPYLLVGTWPEDAAQIVRAALDPHVPPAVDAMYNGWTITRYPRTTGDVYEILRDTWSSAIYYKTAEEAAAYITEFYTR